ncbi:NifB/NifX family molybdenum-iron cluster-binding protein [Sulfurimonas microaerophilic]|uniref:NifB/NifX family molybdenum-iron cluster-binding protein n=1 Tax=Sulfurimonas microaerophilic TaxID=3058392 RepID=UPI002714DA04|nr:NifB/NifX family molybdenum-iron cluster-binding protein [Sulfurimonas sp. hsl 1-7]
MIKIAFASKDGLNVNEHFGWCETFYLYEIDAENANLLKKIDSSKKYEAEVDKLEYKIECVSEAEIVYVTQIGPKAANMVKIAGIYPMKAASESEKVEVVIAQLQKLIANPPLWLQRILLK